MFANEIYPHGEDCISTATYHLTYGFAAEKDIPKIVSVGEINYLSAIVFTKTYREKSKIISF